MKLEIASDDRAHAILVCDEDRNDIAEFYHSDHATVDQSYETALLLARLLVEAANRSETEHALFCAARKQGECDCALPAPVPSDRTGAKDQ